MPSQYFGWDLGGAHVKLALLDGAGNIVAVAQRPCPLWQGADRLVAGLEALRAEFPPGDAVHAVTMTGELCDAFADRASGVRALTTGFAGVFGTDSTVVYGGYDGWLGTEEALTRHAAVASANWLALATFVAERVRGSIVLDIGSTTTDVILIHGGEVRCVGRDDAGRLAHDELCYTGIVRTPVMAVCDRVPYAGRWHNVAAEYFATMADVYRVIGWLDEDDDQMEAADGRGKAFTDSARRLSRMLGVDYESRESGRIKRVARYIAGVQENRIEQAVAVALSRLGTTEQVDALVAAGAGAFLARRVAARYQMNQVDFAAVAGAGKHLAARARAAAPAVCLAKLAWLTL